MAKKRAMKPSAKPAARSAKKAMAPPVTMKDVEDSSIFTSPEEPGRIASEEVPESDTSVENEKLEIELEKNDEDRDLQPEKGFTEDHSIQSSEPEREVEEAREKIPEPEPETETKPSSLPLPEEISESEVPGTENLIQRSDLGEQGTPVPPVLDKKSVEPLPSGSITEELGTGEKSSTQPSVMQEKDQKSPAGGVDLDDESIFESSADLEEIFSAMEDVKKDEAKAIVSAVAAIESGQDAQSALKDLSSDVAEKIQKQLEERSMEEEQKFVTEEDFIQKARNSLSKTWYHCIYFLAFNSESGTATKKVMYDALKDVLSKSPVDSIPEHMFNFGLSALVKVMLYDKPVISFKRGGEFTLEVNRKKLQELLLTAGMPMSRRPVVTKKEEKKMISDFFESDKLF